MKSEPHATEVSTHTERAIGSEAKRKRETERNTGNEYTSKGERKRQKKKWNIYVAA